MCQVSRQQEQWKMSLWMLLPVWSLRQTHSIICARNIICVLEMQNNSLKDCREFKGKEVVM